MVEMQALPVEMWARVLGLDSFALGARDVARSGAISRAFRELANKELLRRLAEAQAATRRRVAISDDLLVAAGPDGGFFVDGILRRNYELDDDAPYELDTTEVRFSADKLLLEEERITGVAVSTSYSERGATIGLDMHSYVAAVTSNGRLAMLGSNADSQLGVGPCSMGRFDAPAFSILPARANCAAVGGLVTLAVTSGGELYAWGGDEDAQCAAEVNNNDSDDDDEYARWRNVYVPTLVNGQGWVRGRPWGRPVVCVSAGPSAHVVAVTLDGEAFTWGRLRAGPAFGSPIRIGGLDGRRVVDAAADNQLTVLLTGCGNVYMAGQFANTWPHFTPLDEARRVNLDVTIAQIAAGSRHALALDSTGVAWAWGHNGRGQLGVDRHQLPQAENPVPILGVGGERVVEVAAGGCRSCLVTDSGRRLLFGDPDYI